MVKHLFFPSYDYDGNDEIDTERGALCAERCSKFDATTGVYATQMVTCGSCKVAIDALLQAGFATVDEMWGSLLLKTAKVYPYQLIAYPYAPAYARPHFHTYSSGLTSMAVIPNSFLLLPAPPRIT